MASSLKNNFFFLSAAAWLLFAFYACNNEGNTVQADGDPAACKAPAEGINPNGSSELAQLMRQMQASAEAAKKIVAAGGVPTDLPAAFSNIHTARPTDSETKKESFGTFATHYLNRLELLYNSPKEEARKNYNALVEACLSCHYDHCPGPIKTINKLKL